MVINWVIWFKIQDYFAHLSLIRALVCKNYNQYTLQNSSDLKSSSAVLFIIWLLVLDTYKNDKTYLVCKKN